MASVRSVRAWGSLAALLLVAGAVVLFSDNEQPRSTGAGGQGLDEFLGRVDQLVRDAHSRRDRARLAQAERLLTDALKVRTKGKDRLWAALGHLQVDRATFDHNATARDSWQVPASARQAFERALAVNPKSVRALEGLAKYHELRKDFRAAMAVDEKLIAVAPGNLKAYEHKGRCQLRLGQYARAERTLQEVLRRARAAGDKRAVIFAQELLGKAYLKQRKFRLAEQVLLAAVEAAEASKVAACPYAALGELYTLTGRQEDAIRTDMRAADMEATVPQMQYLAALTCHDRGYDTEALWYIQRALKLEPNQPSFKKLQGRIRARVKVGAPAAELAAALADLHGQKFRRARIHAEWALAAGADHRARVVKGFLLLLEKKYVGAGKLFTAVGKANPADAGSRVGLGHLGIVRKDYAAARRLLEPSAGKGARVPLTDEARKQYPWLVSRMASLGMGWLLSNQNKHTEALAHFDRVLTGDPNDIFALLGKGNSLNALERLDGAQKLLERVLALDPKNRYATAELALVTLNKGKLEDAERLFKAALRQPGGTRYTCPHEGLGMVYMRAGKLDRAKASFRKAIEINPNIEFKKFNGLARILIREGKYKKARKLLRKSIENYPYDDEAKKLLATIKGR